MDNDRNFAFFGSYLDAVEKLPEDLQLDALKAILRYGCDGTEPADGTVAAMAVSLCKHAIDKGKQRREARSEAGQKGMQTRWSDNNGITNDNKAITTDNKVITKHSKEKDKDKDKDKKNNKDLMSSAASVLDALNRETGRHFKPTEGTLKPIMARLRAGRTVEECLEIIRKQVKAWKDDKRMSAYLRPETLFSSSHFDSYLNAPEPESIDRSERPPNRFHNFEERKTDYDAMLGVI